MRTLSEDTDPAVERMQLDIMARLPAWRKAQLIAGMNAMLSTLAVQGIREQWPGAGKAEVRYRLDEQRLGATVAQQLKAAREGRGEEYEEAYMTGDPVPVTLIVVDALERLDVPYYIGGSLASGIHGAYRATADTDVVADLREDQVDPLAGMLADQFYANPEMMRDAIRHRSSFNLLHLDTDFKVDVFIHKGRAFDRSQLERRTARSLAPGGEGHAYLSDAEGTVLAKLEWYRLDGEVSDRQWTDILGILKVQAGRIDTGYLRHWAGQLGLSDLLERALDDAGLA